MNYDQLYMVNAAEAYKTAFRVVDAIQDASPAEQVGAMSVLFLMLCAHRGVCPRSALEVGDRMMKDKTGRQNEHALALLDYIRGEL